MEANLIGDPSKDTISTRVRKFVDWRRTMMKKKRRLTLRPVLLLLLLLLLIVRSKRNYPSLLAIDRPWRASNRQNPSSRPEIDPVAIPSRVSRNDPSTLAPARMPPPRPPDPPSRVRSGYYADYYRSAEKRAVFDRIGYRGSTRPSISRSSPTCRAPF